MIIIIIIERYFYTFSYARFDRVALELLSLLCTFENSQHIAKYCSIEILFGIAKGSIDVADLQQSTQTSFQVNQLVQKYNTILQPPFLKI